MKQRRQNYFPRVSKCKVPIPFAVLSFGATNSNFNSGTSQHSSAPAIIPRKQTNSSLQNQMKMCVKFGFSTVICTKQSHNDKQIRKRGARIQNIHPMAIPLTVEGAHIMSRKICYWNVNTYTFTVQMDLFWCSYSYTHLQIAQILKRKKTDILTSIVCHARKKNTKIYWKD